MEPMSREPHELPDELDALGRRLELAAAAQLARRQAWWRALRKGAFSVMVGTPLALGIAASDLAPSAVPVDRIARLGPVPVSIGTPTATRLSERRPDASDAARGSPCVMYPDCRPGLGMPAASAHAAIELPRPPMSTLK